MHVFHIFKVENGLQVLSLPREVRLWPGMYYPYHCRSPRRRTGIVPPIVWEIYCHPLQYHTQRPLPHPPNFLHHHPTLNPRLSSNTTQATLQTLNPRPSSYTTNDCSTLNPRPSSYTTISLSTHLPLPT